MGHLLFRKALSFPCGVIGFVRIEDTKKGGKRLRKKVEEGNDEIVVVGKC